MRTAEIRNAGPVVSATDDATPSGGAGRDRDERATPNESRNVGEDVRSRAELLDDFGPPPNDHTPAWGRLAELSARFDGTLDPIVDPDAIGSDARPPAAPDVRSAGDPSPGLPNDNRLFELDGDLGATLDPAAPIDAMPDAEPTPTHGTANAVGAADRDPVDVVVVDEVAVVESPDIVGNTEMVLSMAAERLTGPSDGDAQGASDTGDDEVLTGGGVDVRVRELDDDDHDEDVDDDAAGYDLEQPSHAAANGPVLASQASANQAFRNRAVAEPVPAGPYFDPTYARAGSGSYDAADTGEMVRGGPRWYRQRISQFGVVVGLVPMVILGTLATVMLAVGSGPLSGQLGLLLGTSAAPGLLVAGAPFASSASYPYAAVGSIPLWLLLGWLARRRTLARPIAGWRDYAFQLSWLTLAVIVGAGIALVSAAIRIGGPLLG